MPATDDERYERARRKVESKMAFFGHLAVFVIINLIFVIIAGEDWLWVTLFWGIGLAVQGFNTFFGDSDALNAWKERQIEKEMQRDQPEAPKPPEAAS